MKTVTARAAEKQLQLTEGNVALPVAIRVRKVWTLFAAILCILIPGVASAGSGVGQDAAGAGIFDFAGCARYALVHSEPFHKSRLEIQITSADLKDAHSDLLPSLILVTKLYVARAGMKSFNPLTVEMLVPAWDPYVALVKIKSEKILVDMAQISHRSKVSDAFAEMAKLFYRVQVIDRMTAVRNQLSSIQREKVDYGNTKVKQGSMEPLEVKLWENALKEENLKIRDLQREKDQRLAELKRLMGYNPDYALPLDTRDAANQILTGFNGQFVTFSDIQALNRTLKLAAKQEQLQSNAVTGAYLAILPKPLVVIEGLDNVPNRTSGLNVAFGLNYPIWDGFKMVRDIKRQKMKAEQAQLDRSSKSRLFYNNYRKLTDELQGLQERNSFLREKAALAEMNEERSFMLYKQGKSPGESMTRAPGRLPGDSQSRDQGLPKDLYANYLEKRAEKVQADLESIMNSQDRVTTLIDLATIAGGLERYNAGIRY